MQKNDLVTILKEKNIELIEFKDKIDLLDTAIGNYKIKMDEEKIKYENIIEEIFSC